MRLGGCRAGSSALDHRRCAAHSHGSFNLGAKTLLLTIAGFVLIYTVLLVIENQADGQGHQKGPEHESEPHLSLYEPMIKKLARGQS